MPQMNKGGKFIFGKSLIREDGVIQFQSRRFVNTTSLWKDEFIYLQQARVQADFVLHERVCLSRPSLVTY